MRFYLLASLALFLIEVFIAIFVNDAFIRPYFGDFLVVILIYCFLKIFWKAKPWVLALSTLIFAYAVEVGQYFHLVDRLGLGNNKLAKTIIGYGFDWWDMVAYTAGIIVVLILEKWRESN